MNIQHFFTKTFVEEKLGKLEERFVEKLTEMKKNISPLFDLHLHRI
jgi:hypothetical protein